MIDGNRLATYTKVAIAVVALVVVGALAIKVISKSPLRIGMIGSSRLFGSDEKSKAVRSAMEGAPVWLQVSPKHYEGDGGVSTCFERGNVTVTLIVRAHGPMGDASFPMRYVFDQVAALQTVADIDAEGDTFAVSGETFDCFAPSLKRYYAPVLPNPDLLSSHSAMSGFVIPFGTVRVTGIEFVNEYPFQDTRQRSYRLSFMVDPPPSAKTGKGHTPAFSTTCALTYIPPEDRWVFVTCALPS